MRYAGDGHNHWHVRRMLSYHLWSTHGTSRDAKIGFCFFDTNRRHSLPGAPKSRKYLESGCGTRGSLHTTTGISVGWGDLYPGKFAYQWIDITGLPAGTYTIRASVDLYGKFLEPTRRTTAPGPRSRSRATGSKVKVISTGSKCLNDHDATPYAADIDWAAEHDRGQLRRGHVLHVRPDHPGAVRVLPGPRAGPAGDRQDFFTDDNSNARRPTSTGRRAGLFNGCTATRFCPTRRDPRGDGDDPRPRHGAPPTDNDYFTDDETSGHEANINAAAEAGLMTGCTATTFCPKPKVSRARRCACSTRSSGPSRRPTTATPAGRGQPGRRLHRRRLERGRDPGASRAIAPGGARSTRRQPDGRRRADSNALALAGLMACPIVRTDAPTSASGAGPRRGPRSGPQRRIRRRSPDRPEKSKWGASASWTPVGQSRAPCDANRPLNAPRRIPPRASSTQRWRSRRRRSPR